MRQGAITDPTLAFIERPIMHIKAAILLLLREAFPFYYTTRWFHFWNLQPGVRRK